MYGLVYKTTNLVTGKIYIGQTTKLDDKEYLGSGVRLKNSIEKYGRENFKRETLGYAQDSQALDEMESFLIRTYGSIDPEVGYNLTENSARYSPRDGTTAEKISDTLRGRKQDPEVVSRRAESSRGKTRTQEFREFVSKLHSGKSVSTETRRKLSNSMRKYYETNEFPQAARVKCSFPGDSNPAAKRVFHNGKTYGTVKSLAEDLGVTQQTLYNWIKRNKIHVKYL